ncbi:MAG TPA: hypothetical protein VN688_16900 [Gemmataceae bacterium]|nr:hypothetical protein [Gemmataceae bacterium]
MIFLYTALLLLVGVAHFLIKRRVASLEKKYSTVVKDADVLLRQSNQRDGNSNRQDPYQSAKRQYQLAMLAQKRDLMETRYSNWHARAERLSKFRHRLRAWKGRKLPYTFGVLDVFSTLGLIDYLGAGHYLNVQNLVETVVSLFSR